MDKKKATMMGFNKKTITGQDLRSFIEKHDAKSVLHNMGKKDLFAVGEDKTVKMKTIQEEKQDAMEKQSLSANSDASATTKVTDHMKEEIREEEERPVSLTEQVEILTSPSAMGFMAGKVIPAVTIMIVAFFLGGFCMQGGSGGVLLGVLIWGVTLIGAIKYSKDNRAKNLKEAHKISRKSRGGR